MHQQRPVIALIPSSFLYLCMIDYVRRKIKVPDYVTGIPFLFHSIIDNIRFMQRTKISHFT